MLKNGVLKIEIMGRFQSFVMEKSQYCDHVKEVKKSTRTLELRSKRLGLLLQGSMWISKPPGI